MQRGGLFQRRGVGLGFGFFVAISVCVWLRISAFNKFQSNELLEGVVSFLFRTEQQGREVLSMKNLSVVMTLSSNPAYKRLIVGE